jgi:hypothetical protein
MAGRGQGAALLAIESSKRKKVLPSAAGVAHSDTRKAGHPGL